MIDYSKLAKTMWDAYCAHAGGKTFDGKPLPTWDELGDERQGCWIAAAEAAFAELTKPTDREIFRLYSSPTPR
jgi:hypothetical protein